MARCPMPKTLAATMLLLRDGFAPSQCHDCGAEFYCDDRWEVFCGPCEGALYRQQTPAREHVELTHAQFMEAGEFKERLKRQPNADWRKEGQK